jgi:hypothetical protein
MTVEYMCRQGATRGSTESLPPAAKLLDGAPECLAYEIACAKKMSKAPCCALSGSPPRRTFRASAKAPGFVTSLQPSEK